MHFSRSKTRISTRHHLVDVLEPRRLLAALNLLPDLSAGTMASESPTRVFDVSPGQTFNVSVELEETERSLIGYQFNFSNSAVDLVFNSWSNDSANFGIAVDTTIHDLFVAAASSTGVTTPPAKRFGTLSITVPDTPGDYLLTLDSATQNERTDTLLSDNLGQIVPIDNYGSLIIRVLPDNLAPTISEIDDVTIKANRSTESLAFTVNDPDGDPNSLTVTVDSDNLSLVPLAGITIVGSGTNRSVVVTPLENQLGTANITISVSDGNSTSTSTFQVAVAAESQVEATLVSPSDVRSINSIHTGSDPSNNFHEWQSVVAEVWLTVGESTYLGNFDFSATLAIPREYFAEPSLVASAGTSANAVVSSDNFQWQIEVSLSDVDFSSFRLSDRILVATLELHPETANAIGVPTNSVGAYPQPVADMGIELTSAMILNPAGTLAFESQTSGSLWAVPYDTNDDGRISLADFAQFISNYSRVPSASSPEAYRYDFNRDGKVGIADFALFIQHYGIKKPATRRITFPQPTSVDTMDSSSFLNENFMAANFTSGPQFGETESSEMLPFSTDSYYEMKNTSQSLLDVPYESPSESVSEFANDSQDQELAPELIDAYFSAESSSSYILESEQDLYLWESLDANDLEMPIEAQVLGP